MTGFLGPNGSGKSTTMRMIMGLDRPDAGSALINGKLFAELRWPLREVGALLDAKAFHPARSARNHLRGWPGPTTSPCAGSTRCSTSSGSPRSPTSGPASTRSGMGQRLGIAGALLGDPGVLLFDEPINGLDPEGIRWVRHLLRDLAAEGRTVFVSSHLINEMALTAERLVVIGRGTLIAETSVEEFTARSRAPTRAPRHPEAARFVSALSGPGADGTVGRRRIHLRHGHDLGRDRRAGRRRAVSRSTS